jgi:hypothetical protein
MFAMFKFVPYHYRLFCYGFVVIDASHKYLHNDETKFSKPKVAFIVWFSRENGLRRVFEHDGAVR